MICFMFLSITSRLIKSILRVANGCVSFSNKSTTDETPYTVPLPFIGMVAGSEMKFDNESEESPTWSLLMIMTYVLDYSQRLST
jgi:hypothetical protein